MDSRSNRWQRHDVSKRGVDASKSDVSIPVGADATNPAGAVEASSQTFFADGCEANGTLAVESAIEFDGEFAGRIEGKATVTIGPRAAVQADIKARTVIIHGAVVGNIEGTREVVLGPTAKLHGDIETPSLVIERGAFFAGGTRMRAPIPVRSSFQSAEPSEPPVVTPS